MITIFNKYFERINIMRKYTFAQYTDKFNGVGTFNIKAILCDENLYLLKKDEIYFVAFDSETMGRVDTVKKDSDGEYDKVIEIDGRMIKYKVQTSVVYKQQIYSGTTMDVVESLVKNNMRVGSYGDKRFINFMFARVNEENATLTNISNGQWTGNSVYDAIQPLLQNDKLGFEILPKIRERHEVTVDSPLTNISEWTFKIINGHDRTRKNKQGNRAVIFSHSLSNLVRSTYEKDSSDYTNVAYVAGEGEGNNRTWIEVYQPDVEGKETRWNNIGFLRDELFVDARDLQKTTDDKTYTDVEYQAILKQRGLEYLNDHIVFISYDSTVVNEDKRYKYKKDFFNGDFVTIIDNELGLEVDAQITEVTKSIEGSREILDITFGYYSMTLKDRLRKRGAI